jgi:hypothetical protein
VAYSHIYLERSGAWCFFDDLTALTSVTQQLLFQLDFFAAFAGPIIDSVASKQLTKKNCAKEKLHQRRTRLKILQGTRRIVLRDDPKNCPQGGLEKLSSRRSRRIVLKEDPKKFS